MDIKSILKTVGLGLLSSHPLGALAIPVINSLLPGDSKLPEGVSGSDAERLIGDLPAAQRDAIYLAEIDLKKTEEEGRTRRYEAMAKSDGQETRAKLVNKAMDTLIVISAVFVSSVAYVYTTNGAEAAFSVEMAGVFLTISGTFAYVVRSYFGDLRAETESRHKTIDEKPSAATGLVGILQSLRK